MVKLCAEFKSGDKEEHIVPNGNSVKVEKTINHGTWWAMDPLQKVKITAEGLEEYSFDVITKVIECHSYLVTSKDGKSNLREDYPRLIIAALDYYQRIITFTNKIIIVVNNLLYYKIVLCLLGVCLPIK